MRAPDFWNTPGWRSTALLPLSWGWRLAATVKAATGAVTYAGVPVICVGNLVAGGAGKTPVALWLMRYLAERGISGGVFLSRGYGGRLTGPHLVVPRTDTAADVGDEPLLLAEAAPSWICRHRGAGARAAVAAGAGFIIMDDGLQNPTLHQDLRILVVDGKTGFGNGRVIPAGPLRQTLTSGLAQADVIIQVGSGQIEVGGKPVVHATLQPELNDQHRIAGRSFVAFAGIGRPDKFFATLRHAGATVSATRSFGDHHPYTQDDIENMRALARMHSCALITTEKDFRRLHGLTLPSDLEVLPVRLHCERHDTIDAALDALFAGGGGD